MLKFWQSKGINSSTIDLHPDDSPSIAYKVMHDHTMAIYNQYTFYESPSIGYKAMAKDEKIILMLANKGEYFLYN